MGNYNFTDIIKKIMQEHKLNQSQLSNLLGLRQSQISNWVNGKSLPNYSSLKILKEKLKLTAAELL
jgi:transcriptional regulator with XRE-family HTH domain